jgi:5-methyltetrahydrofolate--homocysteine methyltransferase
VVHVLDASRAVGVASTLVSDTQCEPYLTKIAEEYDAIRKAREGKGQNPLLPLEEARARGFVADMALKAPAPKQPGLHHFDDWDLADLREYFDWTPFFRAWELAGTFPAILDDEIVGESARSLYADAQAMLDRIVAEKWLTAKGVAALWPCRREGDDIVVVDGDKEIRFPFLRQQIAKREGRANMCLADFIDPAGDWIGGFAVTAGHGIEPHLARFRADHDDYSGILLKALADRFAEAFAERLHQHVRTILWGYAEGEQLDNAALVRAATESGTPGRAPG